MSATTPVTMSQGYDVLQPRSGKAYPIPCKEWDVLKKNISNLTFEVQGFHTIGMMLLGAALSTFIAIIIGAVSTAEVKNALVIAWAVVVVCIICGAACVWFASKERDLHKRRASEVVTQMDLIEERFERGET